LLELRIIAFAIIRRFGEQHPQTMAYLSAWYKIAKAKEVDWKKPSDVVKTFGAARVDILKNDRVCIDLGGNNVRIVLKIEYGYGIAFVRWIGWHKDYEGLGELIHKI
jgi:mRNA interferase HigB